MSENQPTLYERLGGINAIATVVDDFLERTNRNPRLFANPYIAEGYKRIGLPALKYLVIEMVGWATGGPQQYTGRTMADSHEHMKITEAEWDAFVSDFLDSLAFFNVPKAEQDELVAIVATTKADIVA